MNYFILFICSMIIPAMNTSAVSAALMNNEVDLIHYILSSGVFIFGIKLLKENKNPIGIILAATVVEDIIINLLCDLTYITYIIQTFVIIAYAVYLNHKK